MGKSSWVAGSMCGVLLEVGEDDELSCRSIDQKMLQSLESKTTTGMSIQGCGSEL